jgi:hypothetical protein
MSTNDGLREYNAIFDRVAKRALLELAAPHFTLVIRAVDDDDAQRQATAHEAKLDGKYALASVQPVTQR